MAFLDELGSKAKNAANQMSGKTKAMSDKAKVEGEIKDLTRQMEAVYLELGKEYFEYDQGNKGLDLKLKENVGRIIVLESQIGQKRNEIKAIESRIVCPNCGKYHPAGTKICDECGYDFETQEMPQPEEQPAPKQPVEEQPAPKQPVEEQPVTEQPVTEAPQQTQPAPEPVQSQPAARFCPNCGTRLDDDMLFCPECGTKIEK